jgi:septal ring factor EnvC (AmiA/AmiB activator)
MPIKVPQLDESVSRAHAFNASNRQGIPSRPSRSRPSPSPSRPSPSRPSPSRPSPSRPSPSGAIVVVSEPEPQEITSARNRTTLNTERATRELHHYRKERNLIERRITELSTEIERISLLLDRFRITLQDANRGLYSSNETQKRRKKQKQKHIFRLHTLYTMEGLQKREEVMRLRDYLQEINENMEIILRKYEDTRTLADIKRGGQITHTRTHTRTRRRKWSLKYKRSIDCKHPKGFSQKQHCKYGRKNV